MIFYDFLGNVFTVVLIDKGTPKSDKPQGKNNEILGTVVFTVLTL